MTPPSTGAARSNGQARCENPTMLRIESVPCQPDRNSIEVPTYPALSSPLSFTSSWGRQGTSLVWFSRQNAKRAQVEHRVTFLNQDALTVDVTPATVVTLYLSRNANLVLHPKLQRELRRGARVVSYTHDMGDWPPERVERVLARTGEEDLLYLWRIAG